MRGEGGQGAAGFGEAPALSLECLEQRGARSDHSIGEPHALPFQKIGGEEIVVFHELVVLEGAAQGRAVNQDSERKLFERQPLVLCQEGVIAQAAPIAKEDPVEAGCLLPEPSIGLVGPGGRARPDETALGGFRQGSQPNPSAGVGLHQRSERE